MAIKDYDQLTSLELDPLKEIGSIGTGNAATALSSLIGQQVRIQMPEVRIMGYNEAIEWIGGPEEITAGVLAGLVTANNNSAYTTAQVRNIVLSTSEPSGGSNGQVWIKYTA